MSSNVVALPLQRDPSQKISDALRELADEIDSGQTIAESAILITHSENPRKTINYRCVGDRLRIMSIIRLTEADIIRQEIGD